MTDILSNPGSTENDQISGENLENTGTTEEIPSFQTNSEGIDMSAYENTDLSQLNAEESDTPSAEKKLDSILLKTVFFGRIAAWASIALLIIVGLYGWTKNQTQESFLMNLPINSNGNWLCTWMNGWKDATLKRDAKFREYLIANEKQGYVDLLEQNKCLALDTIAGWLDAQKKYATDELAKAYAEVIPKKFLGNTITSSAELSIIAEKAPVNRMQHDVVLKLLSDTADKVNSGTGNVICSDVRFYDLLAEARCKAITRSPIQPRTLALSFMKELTNTQSILVTYPSTLDLQVDEQTNRLTTEFVVQMNYIPSRFEAVTLQNLNYE